MMHMTHRVTSRLLFLLAVIDELDNTYQLFPWWQWALIIFFGALTVAFLTGFFGGVWGSIKRMRSAR